MSVPGAVHPLLEAMLAAAEGRFPLVDGEVDVVPACGRNEAVVAFTGHAVVATALGGEAVAAQGPDGYGGALAPDFLRWLAGPTGDAASLRAFLAAGFVPVAAQVIVRPARITTP